MRIITTDSAIALESEYITTIETVGIIWEIVELVTVEIVELVIKACTPPPCIAII